MSMGYQVGVTPLQMVAAVSSVANGGDLIQPRVVRALIRDGKRTEVKPTVLGRDISKDTAVDAHRHHGADRRTRHRRRSRRSRDTPSPERPARQRSSSTAGIRSTDYYASFVGFLPSRNPVADVIVVIDSPRAHGYYGGPIAGPVFQRVAEATLRHLGVPPTLDAPPPVLVARRGRTAGDSGRRAASGMRRIIPVGTDVVLQRSSRPAGLSAREALRRLLTRVGLNARLNGTVW